MLKHNIYGKRWEILLNVIFWLFLKDFAYTVNVDEAVTFTDSDATAPPGAVAALLAHIIYKNV